MWESAATKWGLRTDQVGRVHGRNREIVNKIMAGTKWMGNCYRENSQSRASSAEVPRGLKFAMGPPAG
eukprot:2677943-Prymnesium_polylepis.1